MPLLSPKDTDVIVLYLLGLYYKGLYAFWDKRRMRWQSQSLYPNMLVGQKFLQLYHITMVQVDLRILFP